MGDGQVGGNGSVKWRFTHHVKGAKTPITAKNGGNAGPNEVTDQGGDAEGLDPIPFDEIGTRTGLGLRKGFFKVTLAGQSEPIYVQAVDRTNGQNQNVPMEIKIEW